MTTFRSADGTPIGASSGGRGPSLILVDGGGADRTRWAPVVPLLEAEHTVYNVDRRGRGLSGDAERYDLAREIEDLQAVIAAVPPPVDVVGHWYGAIAALEAARAGGVRRLVLYEPPIGIPAGPPGTVARLRALLDAGDRDGVVAVTMLEVVRVPAAALAAMREQPAWAGRVAAAHTLVRELEAVETYRTERPAELRTPTLLLVGGESPAPIRAASERLAAALPAARIEILVGHGHLAIDKAPDLFAATVNRFLASDC